MQALIVLIVLSTGLSYAQPPVSKVVTAPGHDGVLAPQSEFRGTVYFKELSSVATEVQGKVVAVTMEEGERVAKGQVLVTLDSVLSKKELAATRATYERFKATLDEAEAQFKRTKDLVEDGINTAQEYDRQLFLVKSLTQQAASAKAQVERIEAIIQKSSITAPFDGIVIDRQTERGEWKSDGDPVAVIARENEYDALVDVPENVLPWITPKQKVSLAIGGRIFQGEIVTIIPQGDIATRTFPVKIRINPTRPLYEGMAVIVRLPTAEKSKCVFVPRDALLNQAGQTALFTVEDSSVTRHLVTVLGYEGNKAGIAESRVTADMQFIVKGHERLRNGQQVVVLGNEGELERATRDFE